MTDIPVLPSKETLIISGNSYEYIDGFWSAIDEVTPIYNKLVDIIHELIADNVDLKLKHEAEVGELKEIIQEHRGIQ